MIDKKQTDHPEVDPPEALALDMAPKANVDRYDDLRQAGEKRIAPEARIMKRGVMILQEPPS